MMVFQRLSRPVGYLLTPLPLLDLDLDLDLEPGPGPGPGPLALALVLVCLPGAPGPMLPLASITPHRKRAFLPLQFLASVGLGPIITLCSEPEPFLVSVQISVEDSTRRWTSDPPIPNSGRVMYFEHLSVIASVNRDGIAFI